MKPKIQRSNPFYNQPKVYMCHDAYAIMGFGFTPAEAYFEWKQKEQRRSYQPRYGYWNRQACMRWYKEGCPRIGYYIDGKQIVGYDPHTDQLIMRG